jgi:hypothetical protein
MQNAQDRSAIVLSEVGTMTGLRVHLSAITWAVSRRHFNWASRSQHRGEENQLRQCEVLATICAEYE